MFVHSKSNRQASIVISPSGLIKIHLAPAPSLDLDPLKYKVQNKDLTKGLSTKFTHLDKSIYE